MFHAQGQMAISGGLYTAVTDNFQQAGKLVEDIMDGVRRQLEHLDNPQGFIQLHSPSGGAGSGLSQLISQNLYDDYKKL